MGLKNDLVEKAKALSLGKKQTKNVTEEELALVLAYVRGEVTSSQCSQVIPKEEAVNTNYVARVMAWGYRQGLLVEKQ